MLTMILGGLWHGAKWTFVVWGLYHGLLLVLHRLASPWLERHRAVRSRLIALCWTGLRIVVTFHLVCLGWLIFRADSLEQAAGMLAAIFQRPAMPAAAYLRPRGPHDRPALPGAVRSVRRRRSRRHRPYALVRAQRLLHGVFLCDRARAASSAASSSSTSSFRAAHAWWPARIARVTGYHLGNDLAIMVSLASQFGDGIRHKGLNL